MPMTRLAGGEHCAIEYVQGGEQVGGAGTNEVVRDAFDVAESHRQHGLRAFERLALALLVHAQYQCVLRWAQVQADHVAQLLDEELIGREFEAFAAMRLQAQQLEVTVHSSARSPFRQRSCARSSAWSHPLAWCAGSCESVEPAAHHQSCAACRGGLRHKVR